MLGNAGMVSTGSLGLCLNRINLVAKEAVSAATLKFRDSSIHMDMVATKSFSFIPASSLPGLL